MPPHPIATLLIVLISVAGMTPFVYSTSPSITNAQSRQEVGDPVIAAAGDIACDPADPSYNGGLGTATACRMKYTSDLLANANPAAVLTLGDNEQSDGALWKLQQSFDPTWGRFKSVIHPAVGNHEYGTPGASGYFSYFGTAAGDPSKGYYSLDIGAWHIIVLNGNCNKVGGCGAASPQEQWLKEDLAASSAACTLAYWHQPRFSSGGHGDNLAYDAWWQDLYNAGADVVLNGHDHYYERFAPQTPAGIADQVYGIREFVVGTGGHSHSLFGSIHSTSEVRNSDTFGILKLTLRSDSYDWQFVPESGRQFTDSGTGRCHSILRALHVEGNRIVDDKGSAVILRGVSIEDPYFLKYVENRLVEEDFAVLSADWHVNVVRVPIHPELWQYYPGQVQEVLDTTVAWGGKYGTYILLGWHAHGNPITGQTDSSQWANDLPWHGNPYNPDMNLARQFWAFASERYKTNSWVIYSVFDEPAYISWPEWRPLAEELVDAIRQHNPEALTLVPGTDWSYDLSGAASDPVRRTNLVYEAHPFPGKPAASACGDWDGCFGFLSRDYPVFVGGWGFEPESEDLNLRATRYSYGMPLLNYMTRKGMSWTAWCWSPSWTPRMLQSWTREPTDFGQLVKEELAGPPRKLALVASFGDSITHGYPYGASDPMQAVEKTYPSILQSRLDNQTGTVCYVVVNHGINGLKAEELRANLQTQGWLDENPAAVLVMIGGNDLSAATSMDEFMRLAQETVQEVQDIVDIVKAHVNPDGARPAVIVSAFPPNRLGFLANQGIIYYNGLLKGQLTGVDLFFSDNFDDLYDSTSGDAKPGLMYDTVHPNDAGYAVIAENWNMALMQVSDYADLIDDGQAYSGFSPTTVSSGADFGIWSRIRNIGTSSLVPQFRVSYYASRDTVITSSDYLIGDVYVATSSFSAFTAMDINWSDEFPSGILQGDYWVGWIIDSGNNVAEFDETNNVAYKTSYQLRIEAVGPGSPFFHPATEFWFSAYDMKNAEWDAIHIANTGAQTASVQIYIAGMAMEATPISIPAGGSTYLTYPGVEGSPVHVVGDQPLWVTQRILGWTAMQEIYGCPADEASTELIWTWYDLVNAKRDDIYVVNPSSLIGDPTAVAHVEIYVGSDYMGPLTVWPGTSEEASFPGVIGGPLRLVSDMPVFASQRVIGFGDFAEIIGLPSWYTSTETWFNWYDMKGAQWDAIHILNPGATSTYVEIYVGGTLRGSLTLAPGAADYQAFPGLIGGPVRIVSSQPIWVTQRIIGWGGWREVFGVPTTLATTTWYVTWYDMQGAQWNAIHIINPSASDAQVEVHVGGQLLSTLTVHAGEASYVTYPGLITGPVRVVSDVPIMMSQRTLGWQSFEETIGASLTT